MATKIKLKTTARQMILYLVELLLFGDVSGRESSWLDLVRSKVSLVWLVQCDISLGICDCLLD